jgi:MYXO-CTERM domain-containing protein
MRLIPAAIALTACLLVASGAHATVDGVFSTNIIYQDPQEEGYCYASVPVYGEVGIPSAIKAEASLSPSYALLSVSMPEGWADRQVIGGRSYIDVNAISRGAGIKHSYVFDNVASGPNGDVLEYEAELDVTDLAAENGTDLAGRGKTIAQAKLALLALAKNLKESSPSGLYRLKVSFKGLPSQSGLTGEPVYASSSWPYTGASPVLAAYEKELIMKWCVGGEASALYDSKADTVAGAEDKSSGGCSTATGPAGSGALLVVALLLLGLVVWRVRA